MKPRVLLSFYAFPGWAPATEPGYKTCPRADHFLPQTADAFAPLSHSSLFFGVHEVFLAYLCARHVCEGDRDPAARPNGHEAVCPPFFLRFPRLGAGHRAGIQNLPAGRPVIADRRRFPPAYLILRCFFSVCTRFTWLSSARGMRVGRPRCGSKYPADRDCPCGGVGPVVERVHQNQARIISLT